MAETADQQLRAIRIKYKNDWWDDICKAAVKEKAEARNAWIRTKREVLYHESNRLTKSVKSEWIERKLNEVKEQEGTNKTFIYLFHHKINRRRQTRRENLHMKNNSGV